MAQRGRKPKPTVLKELEGNPGRRPLNKNEPKPNKKAPRCPNVIKLTNVDRQKTEIKDSEADNHESRYLFCLFLSTPKRQIVICQKLTYSKE